MEDCILHVDCNDFSQAEVTLFQFESNEKPAYDKLKVIINETQEEYNYKVIQFKNKYYIVTD